MSCTAHFVIDFFILNIHALLKINCNVLQLGGPDKVAEITGRRGMLVRASSGKGVTYQARNT